MCAASMAQVFINVIVRIKKTVYLLAVYLPEAEQEAGTSYLFRFA